MLRSLKEVQSDDSVVGFYVAAHTGAFFNTSLTDMQAVHQERLRQGGVVVIHGEHSQGRSVPDADMWQTSRKQNAGMLHFVLSA